jgi:hypothetical protein
MPSEVRKTIGRLGPFSSEDIHRTLFPLKRPQPKSLNQLKEGLRSYARAVDTNVLVHLLTRDDTPQTASAE